MDNEEEMKNREDTKKMLEERKLAIMDELSKDPQYPPEIVERINQILNDAAASLPPGPAIEAHPDTRPDKIMERVNQQIENALTQYPNLAPETADKIKSTVKSAAKPAPGVGAPGAAGPIPPAPKKA
jgi:hypothetical protein